MEELAFQRRQMVSSVIAALKETTAIHVLWNRESNRYKYLTQDKLPVSLPRESGVYVFYSLKTNHPVYVGEATDLKRRLGNHCRLGGAVESPTARSGNTCADGKLPASVGPCLRRSTKTNSTGLPYDTYG